MAILRSLLHRFGGCRAIALAAIILALVSPARMSAQDTSATLSGKVTDARSSAALSGARLVIEETDRETTSGPDGQFSFPAVRPGAYHVRASREGFAPARVEVVAGADATPTTISLQPELHYAEVVSVSPSPRDPFESYQPTSVLSGQELSLKLEGSLGELLKTEPGVAQRAFGPGPSRPVIRGLDGDRVLITENGQRTDDLSSQSADHGVAVNPLSAERVEVVRGPATLLHGGQRHRWVGQCHLGHHPDEARDQNIGRSPGRARHGGR